MKKGLSVLLVFALMLGALALPVFAESTGEQAPQGDYYIVGTMNDWTIREDYKIHSNPRENGLTYRFPLFMTPDDSFKIVYSSDGRTPDPGRTYPPGEGTAFNQESAIIKENGFYVFAFRPACDGGRGYADTGMIYHAGAQEVWYYDCIICEGYMRTSFTPGQAYEPATEPGYYIVGTMNDWQLAKSFKMNMHTYTDGDGTTLEMGGNNNPLMLRRGDRFKIAYSEDGETVTRLYPEGEGNAYNEDVLRITYDGPTFVVYFCPNADMPEEMIYSYDLSGKGAHYGIISVQDVSMWDCLTPLAIPPQPHAGGVYREAFLAAYPDRDTTYLDYEELYTHRDQNGDPDWVLVWASNYEYQNINCYSFSVVGNRAYYQYGYCGNPFLTHFGVYDVKQNCFYDPALGGSDGFRADNYPDFARVINENATVDYNSCGRLLGDLDRDDAISIIDATLIQRCEAELREWPEKDALSLHEAIERYTAVPGYYSDFNCDGARDVLDATCIQRYSARMPYTKVQ